MNEKAIAAQNDTIPFIDLAKQQERLGTVLQAAWQRVLSHGRYLNGPEIEEAEQAISEFCHVDHAIMVSSGTDALTLALRAIGIGPGDKVLVPAFTFIAPVQAIVTLGAEPILVDIDPKTFAIDPTILSQHARSDVLNGVKALIAVDLYGCPADYRSLRRFSSDHCISLIADAAQSFGASSGNQKVGTLADITTCSFYPAKPLGVYGDAGAVLTSSTEWARAISSLREHGSGTDDRYRHEVAGYNARMDSLQAGILLAKLTIFGDELASRQRIARRYDDLLSSIDDIEVPRLPPKKTSSWAQYTIRVPAGARSAIARHLKQAGVPTSIHYPRAVHEQPAYRDLKLLSPCTQSSMAAMQVLSLPMHPYLDTKTQDVIAREIRQAVRANR